VVIGDVLLDIDLVGESVRLSPEAPVPVIDGPQERQRPGGAALAAVLASRSTHPVVLIAPVASDEAADAIRALLVGRVELVALPWSGSTPVKTRLRAGSHPVARLDRGGAAGTIGVLPERATAAVAESAAVLISDYGRGAAADSRIRDLVASALRRVPVVWDPHPHGPQAVPGTTLVTPNEKELFDIVGAASDGSVGRIGQAARAMAELWEAAAVCVTLGGRGALLTVGPDAPRMAPGRPVAATDTCGAGDSFAAAAVVALADGALPTEAVQHAVAAANRFVAEGGAAGFDFTRTQALDSRDATLAERLHEVRSSGGVVIATGGCFDLLHAGHVDTLEAARALGDFLVVCLNSDESVRGLKGPQRPLQSAQDRTRVLHALRAVDAVLVFDEETPVEALRRVRPDIWVKGGDYSAVSLPEATVLSEWGGEVVTVPYVTGRSTSALVARAIGSVAR
jgi:rfaE bifunctional protein nucleotidyltransferase chain/domain/rfaE bifunctional protein kinase chain/domain